MSRAAELWTEAAELGSAESYYHLGLCYTMGDGIAQNVAKGVSFYEKAAMLGHAGARHNLGAVMKYEIRRGNYDRAARHLSISAKLGFTLSLEEIKLLFKMGHATKLQYAEALKGYQDALLGGDEEPRARRSQNPSCFQSPLRMSKLVEGKGVITS